MDAVADVPFVFVEDVGECGGCCCCCLVALDVDLEGEGRRAAFVFVFDEDDLIRILGAGAGFLLTMLVFLMCDGGPRLEDDGVGRSSSPSISSSTSSTSASSEECRGFLCGRWSRWAALSGGVGQNQNGSQSSIVEETEIDSHACMRTCTISIAGELAEV